MDFGDLFLMGLWMPLGDPRPGESRLVDFLMGDARLGDVLPLMLGELGHCEIPIGLVSYALLLISDEIFYACSLF